ncbi:hypothetical protein [Evansella clarkii]|uniref:hypothetical protein n=1 Tax=Evansella clarkii TaxID=79879 RepID=UPI0009988883|nr:hypothetical protein [Evansella clarkii]
MPNTEIKRMLDTQKPKVGQLESSEENRYRSGLLLFSTFIREDFLDLPLLPEDRFSTNGVFYTLPFLHDNTLYQNGRTHMLLVVYKVQDGVSECPLRIEFEVTNADKPEFQINVFDQAGDRTVKHTLIDYKEGQCFTSCKELLDMTLSEIVAHFAPVTQH